MTRYLIRCHKMTEQVHTLASNISRVAGNDAIIIAADERGGPVDSTPWAKVVVSDYVEGQFKGLPRDWGWRCGDMCYLAAHAAHPDVSRFWLIEGDVWIAPEHVGALLEDLSSLSQDGIAAGLGLHKTAPRFSRQMTPFVGSDLWGCIFPFTGASARLVEGMKNLRRRILTDYDGGQRLYPNDEAVFSGAILQGGFSYANLYEILPDWFEESHFATNPPYLFEAMSRDQEMAVTHPVIPLQSILKDISAGGDKNYNRHRLRKVLKQATPDEKAGLIAALKHASSR